MGINMFLQSAYNQRDIIKNICDSCSKDMEILKKGVLDFINESKLEGESYDSAKRYLDNKYIPLINGFIILLDEIMQAQERFIEQYKSRVDTNSLQSEVLEHQIYTINKMIYELQSILAINSNIGYNVESTIYNYQLSRNKIEEKLENLINYNDSSVQIFYGIESLLSNIKKGILEIADTGNWDVANRVFVSSDSISEWASELNDKYYKRELELILNKIPDLTESDLDKLIEYGIRYPTKEVPKSIIDYVIENYPDMLKSLNQDMFSTSIEQLGILMMKFGGLVNFLGAIKGPSGSNSFIMINPAVSSVSQPIIKSGNSIQFVGKCIGGAFILEGFGTGVADDIYNEGKSVGEAIAHRSVPAAIGVAALVFGPSGWAAFAVAGVSVLVTNIFEMLYANNFLGVRSILDTVGGWIDAGINSIGQVFNWGKE